MRADEVAQATALGMRQDKPAALNDFVGPMLAPDVVASIVVEDERWALAGRGLPLELETHALVVAVETLLPFRRSGRTNACEQEGRDNQSEELPRDPHDVGLGRLR